MPASLELLQSRVHAVAFVPALFCSAMHKLTEQGLSFVQLFPKSTWRYRHASRETDCKKLTNWVFQAFSGDAEGGDRCTDGSRPVHLQADSPPQGKHLSPL
jgi:hypothetical protein